MIYIDNVKIENTDSLANDFVKNGIVMKMSFHFLQVVLEESLKK